MNTVSFFNDMLQVIAERGRRLLQLDGRDSAAGARLPDIKTACETLLSSRGEASGMALAKLILDRWMHLDDGQRRDFMTMLRDRFGADAERLDRAIDGYRTDPTPGTLLELHAAAEPRRQELIRRLNLAPGGTAALVAMREALLKLTKEEPEFGVVDADFAHLLGSWFNRGFLMLRPISWSTPAHILEKIIRYEAVHSIDSWDELRRRLAPEDRRCFAFFHPQLPDDPLIFVEVALTKDVPARIADILTDERTPISAGDATTAVFYSISNCQKGLRGISFGNFLIKQVVEDLRRELPRLDTFVTLSPVPGFAEWLVKERGAEGPDALSSEDQETLKALDDPGWADRPATVEAVGPVLTAAAAWYFLKARNHRGRVVDPVARFHLGNGARLERINFLADRSARAMRQAHGLMVNYLYKLEAIEANHEAFADRGEVVAASAVLRLLSARQQRSLVPLPGKAAKSKQPAPVAAGIGSQEPAT